MCQFRVHRVMVSKFIPDLCNAIYQCLQIRSSVEKWEKIANQTYKRWEFSIAFATADGKDITYFIHKEELRFLHLNRVCSLTLLARVEYDCQFTNVHCVKSVQIRSYFWSVFSHIRNEYGEILRMNMERYFVSLRIQSKFGKTRTRNNSVGCQECISDKGVYANSLLKDAFVNSHFNLPLPKPLPDIRGGSRATTTSKMECLVKRVNGFQPLTIITKRSILDVAAALDPPLDIEEVICFWATKLQHFPLCCRWYISIIFL